MSKETAEFLLNLLKQQQLSIGADDFDAAVAQVLKARQELQAIIAAGSLDAAVSA